MDFINAADLQSCEALRKENTVIVLQDGKLRKMPMSDVLNYLSGAKVTTDTTLLLPDIPADAKATGEAIRRAAPRNLLDNSNFLNPVNQRRQSTYTGIGYTIDRWKLLGDDSTVVIANDGIAVQSSNNYLQQYVEYGKAYKDNTYTLAVKTTDGTVEAICGKPADNVIGTKCSLGISDYLNAVRISLHPGHTYIWAALYEGTYSADTLPEYQPKRYAEEFLECIRYFTAADAWRPIYGHVSWNGQIQLFVPTPVDMRIHPTGTVIKGALYVNGVSIDINENPANVIKTSRGLQVILATKAEANVRHSCAIELGDTAAYFSADL